MGSCKRLMICGIHEIINFKNVGICNWKKTEHYLHDLEESFISDRFVPKVEPQ